MALECAIECGVMGSKEKTSFISMFKSSMSTLRIEVLSIEQFQTLCGGTRHIMVHSLTLLGGACSIG